MISPRIHKPRRELKAEMQSGRRVVELIYLMDFVIRVYFKRALDLVIFNSAV